MSGINDYKITDTTGYKVQDVQGDSLSGTVAENKEVFDKLALFIIGKYNDMIDYVKTNVINTQISLNDVYPVGSIYMSVNSTNPTSIFGGTWVAWGKGRVPVGVNTSDTDFDTVEETGGQKSVALSTSQMPSHSHDIIKSGDDADEWLGYVGVSFNDGLQGARSSSRIGVNYSNRLKTTTVGYGSAHPNLQPYITCYMWKRTA